MGGEISVNGIRDVGEWRGRCRVIELDMGGNREGDVVERRGRLRGNEGEM